MNSPEPKPPSSRTRTLWQPPSLEELQSLLPAYQFLSLIGRGGMGAVFKAVQISLNRAVAIKVLPADLVEDADANFTARFRHEALTMAKLSHPGIVNVFESGQANGLLYIVMEFVDGTDVARMIQSGGRISPEFATAILTQVCDALQYAHHRGVIHRDLKPANLLVTRERQVKIADFGLAKHHDDTKASLTTTNLALGTPDFAAPEALANTPVDARADLFSLGVTLYQMLTGEVPRGFWEMPSARVGTDPRFDAIIERAMQPKPEARYQSATELRRDLEKIQTAFTPPVIFPRGRPVRRRWMAAAAAAPILILGLLVAWWLRSPKKDSATFAATATTNAPATSAATEPTVRDAALWLVREKADFKVSREGREINVKSEQDIPEGDFQIVYLWFDRWRDGATQPPPPASDFDVMRAVKTLHFAFFRLPGLPESAYAFLAGNPGLKTLFIEGGDVTDEIFSTLRGLRQLESLTISYARRLTGLGLADAVWLPRLHHLDLLACGLTDEAIPALTNCTRLSHLRVSNTPITHEGLRQIALVPRLAELLAGDCGQIDEQDFIAVLPQFHRLKRLEAEDVRYADAFAFGISAALTNLTELRLADTKLTDAGLARLATLPRLKVIRVSRTKVTPEGLAAFEQARPGCQIER